MKQKKRWCLPKQTYPHPKQDEKIVTIYVLKGIQHTYTQVTNLYAIIYLELRREMMQHT